MFLSMKWISFTLSFSATSILFILGTFTLTVEAINVDEELLSLFPENTQVIGFIDVAQLRENQLAQKLIESELIGGRFLGRTREEFIRWTGLDVEKGIEQLMAGHMGSDGFLIILRTNHGTLNPTPYLSERKIYFEEQTGSTLYRTYGQEDWVIALEGKLVFVGSVKIVRDALSKLTISDRSARDNHLLVDALKLVEDGNQIWSVGEFSTLLPKGISPPMATELVDSLERGVLQVRIDTNVAANALGYFNNSDTAARATELLRGFLGLFKAQTYGHLGLAELLENITIDTIESSANIHCIIDGELLRRLSSSLDQ